MLIKASDFLHHFPSCLIAVVMKGVSYKAFFPQSVEILLPVVCPLAQIKLKKYIIFLLVFREEGRGRERNIHELLPAGPSLGMGLASGACTMTRSPTGKLLVQGRTLNHTRQGSNTFL